MHHFNYTCIILIIHASENIFRGALATELLQNQEFREFRLNSHAWTTSKFRFAYTDKDPNFGRNFEGKLIANPKTNALNTLQISFNHFTMSFDMGTYSIYFKFDNVFESIYKKKIIHQLIDTDLTITDLLALINEFNFKMKNQDLQFHAEIVVFIDDKAIASVHMNPENYPEIRDLISKTLYWVFCIKFN